MLPPIQLNAKVQLSTEEIEDVGIQGMLASKLALVHAPASQTHPQQGFSIRGLVPEQPRELNDLQGFASDLVMNKLNTVEHAQTLKEDRKARQASSGPRHSFVIRHSDFVI